MIRTLWTRRFTKTKSSPDIIKRHGASATVMTRNIDSDTSGSIAWVLVLHVLLVCACMHLHARSLAVCARFLACWSWETTRTYMICASAGHFYARALLLPVNAFPVPVCVLCLAFGSHFSLR